MTLKEILQKFVGAYPGGINPDLDEAYRAALDALPTEFTQNASIEAILVLNEIDPELVVETDDGKRRAFEVLESYVLSGLDEIESSEE